MRTYVPGRWTLLAGRELTLFTDAAPDTAVVRECWRLVAGGATVDDVLGAIVHEGLRAIGAFVLASGDRALVRGDVALARRDGAGEWQATERVPTPTWHETAFDAPAMRMATPGADDDAPVLPLSHGIALASTVVVGRDEVVAGAAQKDAAAAEAPASTPDPVVPPRVAPRPVIAVAPAGEGNGESRQYDELFTPSVAPAAVPAGVEATARLTPGPRLAPPPEQPPPRVPPPAPTPAGFIDHLPWAPVGRAGDAPPPPVTQTEPGATLQRPPRATGRGVRVQAVRCPAGHPNPLTAERCRVCRAPVTDREAAEVTRPRLGVLRLSTDPEPIVLERGVVFGREPAGQADVDRIALRRPDISANHVEVRLAGWQVLVVDLGSRNGTVVIGPDGGTAELTPHVPVELRHGTEVVLSDEISFRFEVTS
ncbi:FHA domain-containing protein [Actinophytocola sp. KF-1]